VPSYIQNHVTESASSIHLYRVLEDEYINLYGPLPAEYPWLFLQSHIKDRRELITKIRDAQTPLTAYLKEKLQSWFTKEIDRIKKKLAGTDSTNTASLDEELAQLELLRTLPDFASSDPDGKELKYALVEVFNQVLPDPDFYHRNRFLGVHISDDTKRLLAERSSKNGAEIGTTLICRTNRFLLEDAFHDELEVRDLENVETAHRSYIAAIYSAIHKRERSALCLSGGGIRSATFNLGVLQGLARHGLLDKFDYLSTVSGGGYVGSWLSSWIHREPGGLPTVVRKLSEKPPSVLRPEAEPIQHLRNYSNYLSPRLGLLSADTWTLASIISRNLLLNWLVFIPLLAAVIMIPRLYVSAMTQNDLTPWVPLTVGIGIVFKLMALSYLGYTLPSSGRRNHSQKQFLVFGLTPLVVSAILLTLAWGWANWSGHIPNAEQATFFKAQLSKPRVIVWSIAMGLFCLLVYTLARLRRRFNPWQRAWWQTVLMTLGAAAIISAVSGFVGLLLWKISGWDKLNPGPHPHAFTCFAVPILLALYALSGTLIAGLSSKWTEEDDLEWWARCGAWILIVMFGWAVVTGLVIFGPTLPARLHWPKAWSDWESFATAVAAAVGIISGVLTLRGGFSAGTPAHRKNDMAEGVAETTDEKPTLWQRITPFAAPAFLVFIIIVLSLGTNWLLLSFVAFMNWLARIYNWISYEVAYWLADTRLFGTLGSSLAGLPETFRLRLGVADWLRHLDIIRFTPFRLVTTVWLLLILFGWIMARAINTNMFSIHSLYGNRLKRAYLGASRLKRRPHTFTGFDSADDLKMHELRPELFNRNSFSDLSGLIYKLKQPASCDLFSKDLRERLSPVTIQLLDDLVDPQEPSEQLEEAFIADLNLLLHSGPLYDQQRFPSERLSEQTRNLLQRPLLGESLVLLNRLLLEDAYKSEIKPRKPPRLLHVVNIALNLVRGDRLAWQERKAETFTVSPLHSGNLWLGYRRSKYYGGEDGISLGTAFTISGAAASPNMGYMISSPLVSFLMAMFNVRLGWWLGNPGRAGDETYRLEVPRFAFGPIVQEALSLTDDASRYVYLSDGGHFENLGLYEMVLRRCKVIIVSDASTDQDYTYDSLGMAIRKIRIDLGIPIEMPDFGIRADHPENPYFTIGRIAYSCVDDDGTDGTLIYIKASLSKREPRDILNYWRANRDFPQEEIADQFFTESQFESYRMLGSFIVDSMCEGEDGDQDWQANGLSEFVDRLMQPQDQRSSDERFQFARLAPAS
jgi:hypothetical protein